MPPYGQISDEDIEQELAEDNRTPFSPPDGADDTTDDTHPQADTNVDAHELYDEGISGADEVSDPGNRGIIGLNKDFDHGED